MDDTELVKQSESSAESLPQVQDQNVESNGSKRGSIFWPVVIGVAIGCLGLVKKAQDGMGRPGEHSEVVDPVRFARETERRCYDEWTQAQAAYSRNPTPANFQKIQAWGQSLRDAQYARMLIDPDLSEARRFSDLVNKVTEGGK